MAQREREQRAASDETTQDSQAEPTGAETVAMPEASIEPASAEERVVLLEAEIAGLKDQLLRALAEAENQRRRAQREREETLRYAAAPLARDLAAVADNLRRALDAVPAEARSAEGPLGQLASGLELTERELLKVLEKHGIAKIVPLGEMFDPHRHEAMFELPDPSAAPGSVVQVLEPGYLLHDRLLRPARVGVAKAAANGGNADRGSGPAVGSQLDTKA
ncbi:MAG: nucleotide exchange factor GrpE [Kiloniellales bacterium]